MASPLHASDDRLIDLIQHLLPAEEEQSVLAHLEGCAQCEGRFRILLADHERARSLERPGVGADGVTVRHRPRPTTRWRWAAGAAVAAALVVVWYVAPKRAAHTEYWIEADIITTLQRGEDELASPQLSDAFATYARHDATSAAEALRNAPAPNDELLSSLRLLLLGSAELNAGQARESLANLEKLGVDTLPPRWRSEARWVHYLALRAAGEGELARARLATLADEDSRIGRMAREELARLGERR